MSEKVKLVVGQRLWFVPKGRYASLGPFEIEVTSVGRKWARARRTEDLFELDGLNVITIDVYTLKADGGTAPSPGRCFLSREVYEANVRLRNTWLMFRTYLQGVHEPPSGLAPEDIHRLAEQLGFNLKAMLERRTHG
jgi:hypothetical protein